MHQQPNPTEREAINAFVCYALRVTQGKFDHEEINKLVRALKAPDTARQARPGPADLSADQIDDTLPPDCAHTCDQCGYLRTSAQQLHDLVRSTAAASHTVVELEGAPIVVDFESTAARYRAGIAVALRRAGAPFFDASGRKLTAAERIEWLARRCN